MRNSPSMSRALAVAVDKQQIYEVLCRYCRGVDRADYEMISSCYHSGAIDHHAGGFDGPVEEFMEYARERIEGGLGTMHVIANHRIEVDGDIARSETYVNTWSWDRDRDGSTYLSTTGTRYVDRFERRADEWRIAERWTVRGFKFYPQGRLEIADGSDGPVGLRSRDDVSYSAGCPADFDPGAWARG